VNAAWGIVIFTGLATAGIKAAGPVLLGGRALPARLDQVIALLAPAMLGALVAINTFASGRSLTIDARAAGIAAAFVAIRLRAPLLAVVVAAAAVTAIVRAAS
jgi:branched-subunit amino acid transport protein